MRRLSVLALALLVSACATRPVEQAAPAPVPTPPAPRPVEQGRLIGKTAADLVGYFGNPALQVREGTSLKLQFRSESRGCVLDAYLYPSAGNVLRVTHVDTRSSNGADMDQAACILALSNPS